MSSDASDMQTHAERTFRSLKELELVYFPRTASKEKGENRIGSFDHLLSQALDPNKNPPRPTADPVSL